MIVLDILLDALLDTAKLLPFLFLTYLLMEYIEHHAQDRLRDFMSRAGRLGPVVGGLAGAIPQCGFSASAAGLYSGRVISVGTLLAVFLSTSDELLPIFISAGRAGQALLIIGVKAVVAVIVGFVADVLFSRHEAGGSDHIHDICTEGHCHCERGIWRSALHHTVEIGLFVLVVNMLLGGAIELVGHDRLAAFAAGHGLLSYVLAALVGLIPNCASSVLLSELCVSGVISAGTLLAGSFSGAGVGIVVLLRTSRPMKTNLFILLTLFVTGIAMGGLFDLVLSLFA